MEDESFAINYQNVVSDQGMCSVVKMTAMSLMKNPYMTLEVFFKKLNDYDVDMLSEMVNDIREEEENDAVKHLLLLSEMLARAEGTEGTSIDDSLHNFTALCTYISLESLKRKGLVEINYKNMSFGREFDDKEIAKVRE